jgi:class 3 adenylate cyclase/tetratricopeptide (TPR) repeat protein
MTCPHCGSPNEPERKFCGDCGGRLARACATCGTANAPSAKFCGECGTRLDGDGPAPADGTPPELRMVSVLFVDLVDYTSLSEGREAEDVRELLTRYFEVARTIVGRHGGTVEKFIGDAVMAVWGTPTAHENDAEMAVRAALELVGAVGAFGADAGVPGLQARAGVVTGQAATLTPDQGLVIGDRVNTAARVQSAARPGTVFVDAVTRQAAAAAIAFEDAGEHTLKGKAEPLRLWLAVRAVAGAGGAGAEEDAEAPFVGRDAELRLLKDLFHGAVDRGSARLVVLTGAPGVGKSRLRRELEHYIDGLADTVLWHSGRSLAYGNGVAYWALAQMVRQRLGIAEDSEREEAGRRLALGLERWILDPAERSYLAPRLGSLVGATDPGLDRQELVAGWRLFFERLADHSPVVLAFEDLHWADAGLLDFIDHLISWSARKPIVILALARPELSERRPDWSVGRSGVVPFFLEPLPDGAIAGLLERLVAGLPAGLSRRIVGRAEGVPLYALETIRALADRGALVATGADGRLELVGDVAELEVPPTLTSLLTARLDALTAEERALVKTLSVFGGSFPRQAARAISDRRPGEVDAGLAALTAKQVLVVRADALSPDRGQYAFAQALLRTVAHDLLSRRERKALHLAAAAWLKDAFPEEGAEVAEVIAAHHLDALRAGAGDADESAVRAGAFAAVRRAARRAEAVGAPEGAEGSYLEAADLADSDADRAAALESAGLMAARAGRYERSIELLDRAGEVHTAAGRTRDAARVVGHAGPALRYLGRNAEAIERMQAALSVLDPDDLDPAVAELNFQLGTAALFAGRLEEAHASLERALVAAEALRLPSVLSNALSSVSLIMFFSGRPEQSRLLAEGAASVAARHGLNHERMRALSNLGELHVARDDPAAEGTLTEALGLAGRLGDRGFEGVAAGNLMGLHLLTGRWDEVREIAARLLDADGEHPEASYLHHGLALLEALRGDAAAASRRLAHLTAWEATEDIEDRELYETTAVAVDLAARRYDDARERAVAAARTSLASFGPSHSSTRSLWPYALDAALATGRRDIAAELLVGLDAHPPGAVPRFLSAHAARGRGLLGDGDAAEGELVAAVTEFAELGYPYWEAQARVGLAGWLVGHGRGADAVAPLDAATAVFEGLGAHGAAEDAAVVRARAVAAAHR